MNLKEAMESVPRCIMMYEPERDCWAATDTEGWEWSSLRWYAKPSEAVSSLLHGEDYASDFAYDPSESEIGVVQAVADAKQPWACEWWHGSDGTKTGEWLRPFAVPAPA